MSPQEAGLKEIPGNDPLDQFQYPKRTSVRGPCPALNTMANHDFINRDGITTFAEATNGCQLMLGVAYDNCIIVSGIGLLAGENLPSDKFSIGGADSRVPNTFGPSLGVSKHGLFEIDNSVTRQDAYFGNQADFLLDRFERLTNIAKKHNNQFGLANFAEERVLVYNEAKMNNPEFTALKNWLGVTAVECAFVFRGFINGTDPDKVDYKNVASSFLNESIPEKWFRRAEQYNAVELSVDIANLINTSPELTLPGQNQGANNFVPSGLDIRNVSPGTAMCIVTSAILDNSPGFLSPALVVNYEIAEAFVNGAIKSFFALFNCPVKEFAKPGPNASGSTPGVSTTYNVLINGTYQPQSQRRLG